MSKHLAQLLDKPEAEMARTINQLEEAAGLPSEDIRLLSENKLAQKRKIKELGLDADDTTGRELYHALLNRYANDSRQLNRALGVSDRPSAEEKILRASQLVKQVVGPQELWAVKPASLKSIIKAAPPRHLMKRLGYRTVDSILKRQAVEGVALAAPYTESKTWATSFRRTVNKFDSSHYALRPLSLIALEPAKFKGLSSDEAVFISTSAAAVGLNPLTADGRDVLSMAAGLIEALGELNIETNTDNLLRTHPALLFWQGTDHLLYRHGRQAVSFNLKDVAHNYHQANEYHQRQHRHGQAALSRKLAARYKAHNRQAAELVKRLQAGGGL